jgi:hypothetical protein
MDPQPGPPSQTNWNRLPRHGVRVLSCSVFDCGYVAQAGGTTSSACRQHVLMQALTACAVAYRAPPHSALLFISVPVYMLIIMLPACGERVPSDDTCAGKSVHGPRQLAEGAEGACSDTRKVLLLRSYGIKLGSSMLAASTVSTNCSSRHGRLHYHRPLIRRDGQGLCTRSRTRNTSLRIATATIRHWRHQGVLP